MTDSTPQLDDTDDRVTGWCRNPSGCTDPECACLALRRSTREKL